MSTACSGSTVRRWRLSITGGVDRYRGAGGFVRVFSTGQQSLLVMHFTP